MPRRSKRRLLKLRRPDLHVADILAWADEHRQRTGKYPIKDSGRIVASPDDTWSRIDLNLRRGDRGLPKGSSLSRLLADFRGYRHRLRLPPFTIPKILRWADAHYRRTGRWPTENSGPIHDAPGETWMGVQAGLSNGARGLPGGSSLARLLAQHRGYRNLKQLPRYAINGILEWVDAHHRRTGSWPLLHSGPIPEAPGETWAAVDSALKAGTRGMTGGSSLAQLLAERRGYRNIAQLPRYTLKGILRWADAHYLRTGRWPRANDGPIEEAPGETWMAVAMALSQGNRGLPGGSSLAQLLAQRRGYRNRLRLPRHTIRKILQWADAHFQRTGCWPNADSGAIAEAPGETWSGVDVALVAGNRGLPGGSSLAQLLAERRGYRNPAQLPPYTIKRILQWADAHHQRTGRWPTAASGAIPEAPGETWGAVDSALWSGTRGLSGGTSLAKLLAKRRGYRNIAQLPPYTVEGILQWADAHHRRTGRWPSAHDGPIPEAPGETWMAVSMALSKGNRGLPGGSSLAQLLVEHRGVSLTGLPADFRGYRNRMRLPRFTVQKILQWADAYHDRTGRWPNEDSGPIAESPGDTWMAVQTGLMSGTRGLPGGSSLAKLLAQRRGYRNIAQLPKYTFKRILEWADAYHRRHGRWPAETSGAIPEAPGETWAAVSSALAAGKRGLPGGSSLAKFLAERRGHRNRAQLPRLTLKRILQWADAHHRRTGRWPTLKDGPIREAPGETWVAIGIALSHGRRGLPGGSSLAQLLSQRRGYRNRKKLPRHTIKRILQWCDAHYRRTGQWPRPTDGAIPDAPGETWAAVQNALRLGLRGLLGGSSIFKLLAEHRGVARRSPAA